jgi:pteridine reductase
MDLQGRVALITGSARRVGKAIALGLASRGADVMVHYHRSADEAARTVAEIRAQSVHAESVQADLSVPSAIEVLFDTLRAEFGRVDVLVNSASVFQAADLLDVTVDDWEAVMAVNLRAPFLCSQHAARMMQSGSGDGVIINIADIAGQVSWVRFPHHSVSKAGLIMLTRVLAKSLGPGIRANAVVPGPVMKPEGMPDVRWQALGDVLPLGRTGSPQNVVQAVLALVENDFITGTILNVDGGDALIGSVDVG